MSSVALRATATGVRSIAVPDPAAASERPRIAVIIPALDEEHSVGRVLDELPVAWADDVIVADNGSRDRTAWVAERAGATVVLEPERGYGAACLAGLASLSPDSEIVVFLDADLSDYPEDIEKLVSPILEGRADFVLGSRMLESRARAALTVQQRWGNTLAVTLIRWRFGFRYSDLGPFRAIRRDALDRLGMCDRNYGWTVEMQIKAIRAGLRVVEVPVGYRQRIGRSKISGTVRGVIGAGAKILFTVFRYSLERVPASPRSLG